MILLQVIWATNPLPPDLIILGKVIGIGSFAQVKLAEKKEKDSKKYATKIYNKCNLKNKHKALQLLKEIECLALISHQNIVKFIGYIETSDQIHLVTDYVGSLSLANYVKLK